MSKGTNLILTLLFLVLCAMLSDVQAGRIEMPEVIEGQYIIVTKANQRNSFDLEAAVYEAGGELISMVPEVGMAVAISEAQNFSKKLTKRQGVAYVIPDLKVRWLSEGPSVSQGISADDEPLYSYQWNMDVIKAEKAWEAGCTGKGVRVAVLDTGIDPDHPDLESNIDPYYSARVSCYGIWPDYSDDNGHGTWTAGIIAAADNEHGVIGVAPEATIVAVKVLDEAGEAEFSTIVCGMIYAAIVDADVINMSLSGYLPKSGRDPEGPFPAFYAAYYLSLMNEAITFVRQLGATVISAAGNDAIDLNQNEEWVVLPAEAGNGIAVSATGPVGQENFDNPASYTNYGTSAIDIAAPGGDHQLYPEPGWELDMVLSTWPDDYVWADGTSASAPHVSGVAALIIGQHGGGISPALVKAIIEQAADDLGKPGMDDFCGRGRINAFKAISR
jgi:subtilisin family serine protease